MTRLLLVRHGITEWNVQSRFQGQADIPLSESGRLQAEAIGRRLARETIHAMYASDLSRAWETACVIAAQACSKTGERGLFCEPRLREISFGEWEGLIYSEIQSRDPETLSAWQADIFENAPPGGETLRELAGRVTSVLEGILTAHPQGTTLLVAHGGPLQILICQLLRLPVQMYWQFHLAPASLSEITTYPEGAILNLLNDTCHLSDLEISHNT